MGDQGTPHERHPLVIGRFVPSARVHLQILHNIGLDAKHVPLVDVKAVFVGIASDYPIVKEKMTVMMPRTDCAADSWVMNHMGISSGNLKVKEMMIVMIPRTGCVAVS